jgi:hypothetical protein
MLFFLDGSGGLDLPFLDGSCGLISLNENSFCGIREIVTCKLHSILFILLQRSISSISSSTCSACSLSMAAAAWTCSSSAAELA